MESLCKDISNEVKKQLQDRLMGFDFIVLSSLASCQDLGSPFET